VSLSPTLRWTLAATLVATAVLALQPEPDAVALAKPRASSSAATKPTSARAATTADKPWPPARRASGADWPAIPKAAVAAWQPPAPPPAPVAPRHTNTAQAAPEAPPFPYTLIGRLEDRGVTRALLAGATRTIDAKVGDLIDGQWRVEAVEPSGLQLVWVPGGQRQTLSYRPT